MSNDDDATEIGRYGWRQGSFLPPTLFEALSRSSELEFNREQHCAIVVTQDCDLVHPSYSVEPFVEVVRGTVIPKADGSLLYGKSARRLHLQLSDDSAVYDLQIRDRRAVDRRILVGTGPGPESLSEHQKRQLARWLARRYKRAAFPDAFANRLRSEKAASSLRKLLRVWGQYVSGIFVLLDPAGEVDDDVAYQITVWATVPGSVYSQPLIAARLQVAFQPELKDALSKFDGIELLDAMVVSQADFSLDDIESTRRLDLDDLSHRDGSSIADQE